MSDPLELRLTIIHTNEKAPRSSHRDALTILDVDGVFCPLHTVTPDPAWGEAHVIRGTWLGDLAVAPAMARAIQDAGTRLSWCTDWQQEANRVFAPFFGGRIPVMDRSGVDENPWWKLNAVLAHLDVYPDIRRLIWADDHLSRKDDHGRTMRALAKRQITRRGVEAHFIAPNPRVGLTRRAWEKAEDWLDETSPDPFGRS